MDKLIRDLTYVLLAVTLHPDDRSECRMVVGYVDPIHRLVTLKADDARKIIAHYNAPAVVESAHST